MHSILLVVLLITGGSGRSCEREIEERVDLIELNYTHYSGCSTGFYQVIFWDWSPDYRRHDVAWTMQTQVVDQCGDECVVRWFDSHAKVRRVVRAKLYRETDTATDPERENQRLLPCKLRRGLGNRKD